MIPLAILVFFTGILQPNTQKTTGIEVYLFKLIINVFH